MAGGDLFIHRKCNQTNLPLYVNSVLMLKNQYCVGFTISIVARGCIQSLDWTGGLDYWT